MLDKKQLHKKSTEKSACMNGCEGVNDAMWLVRACFVNHTPLANEHTLHKPPFWQFEWPDFRKCRGWLSPKWITKVFTEVLSCDCRQSDTITIYYMTFSPFTLTRQVVRAEGRLSWWVLASSWWHHWWHHPWTWGNKEHYHCHPQLNI